MKIIGTIKAKNKEDSLKYAYAFMLSETLNIKECSFVNPKPSQFSKDYIMPRDMYSATYSNNVPSWEAFKSNPTHQSASGYSCVACLDKKDQKRVSMIALNNLINFNCYGNYESEARKAFETIESIYSTL